MDRIPSPTKYIGQLKRQRYMRIYGCSPRICTAIYIFRLLVMVYMRALALVVAAVDCLLLHSHSCTAQFIRYLHMHCTGQLLRLNCPFRIYWLRQPQEFNLIVSGRLIWNAQHALNGWMDSGISYSTWSSIFHNEYFYSMTFMNRCFSPKLCGMAFLQKHWILEWRIQ